MARKVMLVPLVAGLVCLLGWQAFAQGGGNWPDMTSMFKRSATASDGKGEQENTAPESPLPEVDFMGDDGANDKVTTPEPRSDERNAVSGGGTMAAGGAGATPSGNVWEDGLPREVLKNPKSPSPDRVMKEVNWGIAAKYTDDKGLEKDRAVFFAVDFDKGAIPNMAQDSWGGLRWATTTQISDREAVSGRYCAANTWAAGKTGGSASRWYLGDLDRLGNNKERPVLFFRLYHKFDPSWFGDGKVLGMKGFGFVVQAEKHNANLRCNGRNWFTSEMQWVGWGPSAKREVYNGMCIHGHYYSYLPYPAMIKTTLGEKLRPTEYRFSAYANPPTWVHLDEWYCYEVALFMNTPGKDDGEARYWENGKLTTRITNMRYADTWKKFRAYATIQNYRTQHGNITGPATRYIDNVVVARRYIGPIQFSKERLQYFLDNGIVVHTGDEGLTQRMRAARVKKKGHR